MNFGLSGKDFDFIQNNAIKKLWSLDATVWVFGSRARGDHKEFSDLDLYIESKDDISKEIDQIEETLIESDLPIKVDIVLSSNFAESYRTSLDSDKVLWP